MFQPAFFSAARDAGIGPEPMIFGSTPAWAQDTIRASGFLPSLAACLAVISTTAAAPSFKPLTLLSGTFYAIDRVSPTMAILSHANPFFYVIDGFRYGFLGVADGLLLQGALVLAGVNLLLWWVSYRIIKSGWRLRA